MLRSVWLRNEAARDGFENDATLCFPLGRFQHGPLSSAVLSFEDAFRRHYPAVRELLEGHRAPGLGLLVVGQGKLEGKAWIPAEPDGINPVIVGRHSTAELFLPSDPELSLRHLAIVVGHAGDGPARFRVLDLRTPTAFEDEHGHRLRALESAGPTLIRCASYSLLLLPTGDSGEPWPEDKDEGWKRVPERVYLESTSADSDSWNRPGGVVARSAPSLDNPESTTPIVVFPGPVFLARALMEPSAAAIDVGAARGEIRVSSELGDGSLLLDAEAARRGALIGRYERCDGAGLACLSTHALSRVHLLVVESGGALWAVDTASRNGSWHAGERIGRLRLEPGRRILLAGQVAVEWCPFN
jgi:hypothetical protein